MSKRALGRGLNTLLPVRSLPGPEKPTVPAPLNELPIDQIVPNPFQPRSHFDQKALEELAQSIRTDGIIQPLVVRPGGKHYQLIAGERRWRAAQIAGLPTVPVHVQDMPDDRMLEVALVENIQREDLNPIESAMAFQRMSEDLGFSHEEIGQRTGKDRATVSNSIRLLQLPEDVRELIRDGKLSPGHGRALLKLSDPAEISTFAHRSVASGWSVRQMELFTTLHNSAQPPGAPEPPKPLDPNVKAAVSELERVLGTRVRIVDRGRGKGKVEIDYYSPEDLDRIYAAIVQE